MAHRLRQRVKREDDMEIDIKELDEEEKEDLEIAQREIEMSAASQFLDIPFDQWCRVFLKVKQNKRERKKKGKVLSDSIVCIYACYDKTRRRSQRFNKESQ